MFKFLSRSKNKSLLPLFLLLSLPYCLCTAQNSSNKSNTHGAENHSKNLENKEKTFFDFTVKDIHGKDFNLSELRNKVVLVVNTASACGFTPQLKDLEEIYQKYSKKGFIVLAFPSNDFHQDKGSNTEIEKFAKEKYQISFPIMDKNPVSGKEKQPVFKFLTESKSGFLFREVQWNFEKFLISKKGLVIERWSSMTSPNSKDITSKIETELLN